MTHRILIIDDDEKLNELVKHYLKDFGYEVFSAATPVKGHQMIARKRPDLIILDIMLPGQSGFEVLRDIREHLPTPVIMLTARGDLADKVTGLELGADDYLSKPFEPRELVARIQSVLRRVQKRVQAKNYEFDRLKIDLLTQIVHLDGKPMDLTTNEFSVLSVLAGNAGKVMSRDDIMLALKGLDCDAFNRSIDITISRIRQKLGDPPKNPHFIKTIWGTGYVFLGQRNSK